MKSKYLMLLVVAILCSCNTINKTQKRSAREEKDRQKHIKLLEETRKKFPCITDTLTRVDTLKTFIPGDSIPCPPDITGTVVKVKCPDVPVIITNRYIQILDSAEVEQYRDSIDSFRYLDDLKNEDIRGLSRDVQKMEATISKLKSGRDNWRNVAIPAIFIILVGLIMKIKGI